jgi:hypothetical protein
MVLVLVVVTRNVMGGTLDAYREALPILWALARSTRSEDVG